MSARAIWLFGFTVFAFLILVALAGLTAAAQTRGQETIPFEHRLATAALARTRANVRYDSSYRSIAYPLGDVPADRGVCTDVIIRSFRTVGIDLQQLVHEDMARDFKAYPQIWGLQRPDSNIDHRRVPNLQVFFTRHGQSLAVSHNPESYAPGDLVTWEVPPHLPHIGIVADQRSPDAARPLIVHNIGAGPQIEDRLFDFPITGHYRYSGPANL